MTDIKYLFESTLDKPLMTVDFFLPIVFFLAVTILLFKTRRDARKFIIVFFILFSYMELSGIYDRYMNNKLVADTFKNKTYLTTEGEIENLYTRPKNINFDVNNIHFHVSYTGHDPKKSLEYTVEIKNKNGVIKSNGQKVKIYYIQVKLPTLCIPWVDRCIVFNEGQENKIIKMWVYD